VARLPYSGLSSRAMKDIIDTRRKDNCMESRSGIKDKTE
jgi:hypothetical protein